VINIRADGSIWVDGRQMDLPALEQAMLGESAKARKTGQSLHVVVRADRRQRYANLDKVLDIWGKTGLAQVDFRAEGG
jgi:biopolymer transport protein ExbD